MSSEVSKAMRLNNLLIRLQGPILPAWHPEIEAEVVAILNEASLVKYPSNDQPSGARWQFWSKDGAHFLGNESKFTIPKFLSSIEATRTLIQPGWGYLLRDDEDPRGKFAHVYTHSREWDFTPVYSSRHFATTIELAFIRAALGALLTIEANNLQHKAH